MNLIQDQVVPQEVYSRSDHSRTYREQTLKNLPHRRRLQAIMRLLSSLSFQSKTYADVGCSNGYITALVMDRFKPALAYGFDHNQANLTNAKRMYPHVCFDFAELNDQQWSQRVQKQFDVVTCFETLEHVGELANSLTNLLALTRHGGTLVLTVPIEVGAIGTLKFIAKMFYRYNLGELPGRRNLSWMYFSDLIRGTRMSKFRDRRPSWGTHFGFDYRDVDDFLLQRKIPYEARNEFTTRFYRAYP